MASTGLCIPQFLMYEGCTPERFASSTLQFFIGAWLCGAGLLTILVALSARKALLPNEKWNSFFVISICVALCCLLGAVNMFINVHQSSAASPMHPSLHFTMMNIGPTFIIVAVDYMAFCWAKLQRVDTFLVYGGLHNYRTAFWTKIMAHLVLTSAASTLLGFRNLDVYLWTRIYWGLWFLSMGTSMSIVIYFGRGALKHADKETRARMKRNIVMTCALISMCMSNFIFEISVPELIDRTPWAWHVIMALLYFTFPAFSLIATLWSFYFLRSKKQVTRRPPMPFDTSTESSLQVTAIR